jgi:hypothetical protein
MRDGNQLERTYAAGFKVPFGICLRARRMKTKKKMPRWSEGGQMLLHVAQSSMYTGLVIGKSRGIP